MSFRLRRQRAVAAMLPLALGVVAIAGMPPAAAAGATVGNVLTTSALGSGATPLTPAALATALVDSSTVTVSGAKFTGSNAQAGLISIADPALVSFNNGVIMSSGNIADVAGPNKSDGITGDMVGPQDESLTAMIANTQTVNPMTYDAAVLEFDITPTANTVYFTYVFGSDEYLEWVNLFNDAFGFWINGTNCATVVDATTGLPVPVTIDTINDAVNTPAYRDNSFAAPPANPLNIEMDGLSVELICQAAVVPNVKNHVKLAIADTSDQILDSIVILKSGTLSTTKPESCNNGDDDNGNSLIEMEDNYCKTTVTPAPTSGTAPATGSGGHAAAFTGNEGEPIYLDASALGWKPTADTLNTTWTVTGINGTVGTCVVSPATAQPVDANGDAAVVTAVCPKDGEYVAHIFGWDVEAKGSWDTDVDFFVHNAPPVVDALSVDPAGAQAGTTVTASALVYDPAPGDTVTCEVSWGDGSTSVGVITNDLCEATHVYATGQDYLVSITGTDAQKDAAAAAIIISIAPANTPPALASHPASATVTAGQSVSFHANATGDPKPTVRWQSKVGVGVWTDINGATSDTYTFTAQLANSGTQYRAVYDNVAGTATSNPATLTVNPAVSLTTFTPTTGGKGTSVTITGTGLDKVTAVTFNGAAAPLLIASPTLLFTAVPANATTGKITLTYAGGSTSSATNFTYSTTAKLPTITAFSPTSAVVGTAVKLTGTNLIGTTAVKFGTVAAVFTVDSPTQITTSVPVGAITAKIAVTTAGGTASSASTFTVTVVKTNSVLTYTGTLTATKSTSFALQATLKTAAGAVLSGKSVKFTFNAKTYTATTNASGIAAVTVTAPKTAGNFAVSAAFAGDTTTNLSSVSATIVIK